jgi:uncharacterized cupredoxin-like copper-binding protein
MTVRQARRDAIASVAVLVLALALVACGDDEGATDTESPDSTVVVTMRDLAFAPTGVSMASGDEVRVQLQNDGALVHDFTMERMPHRSLHMIGGMQGGEHMHEQSRYAMHMALEPGSAGSLDFAPTEPGEYEFFCTVPGHREAGMRGTIRVE